MNNRQKTCYAASRQPADTNREPGVCIVCNQEVWNDRMMFHFWISHHRRQGDDMPDIFFPKVGTRCVIGKEHIICPWCGETVVEESSHHHLQECDPYLCSKLTGSTIRDVDKIREILNRGRELDE